MTVVRNYLFEKWLQNKKDAVLNSFLNVIGRNVDYPKLWKTVRTLCNVFRSKWNCASRTKDKFLERYCDWFSESIDFSGHLLDVRWSSSTISRSSTSVRWEKKIFWPRKEWSLFAKFQVCRHCGLVWVVVLIYNWQISAYVAAPPKQSHFPNLVKLLTFPFLHLFFSSPFPLFSNPCILLYPLHIFRLLSSFRLFFPPFIILSHLYFSMSIHICMPLSFSQSPALSSSSLPYHLIAWLYIPRSSKK